MSELAPVLPYFFTYGYVALFFLVFLGAVYIPVPSNLALIGAGILSQITQNGVHFNIFLAAAVGLIANVLGDMSGYFIALKFGNEARQRKFERKHASYEKLSKYLKSHTLITVGVSRLVGFASPWVNALSGFTKIPAGKFLLGDVLGNTVYISLYIGLGYILGNSSSQTFTIICIIAAAVFLLFSFYAIIYILFIRNSNSNAEIK
jgi:membrane-associated protein